MRDEGKDTDTSINIRFFSWKWTSFILIVLLLFSLMINFNQKQNKQTYTPEETFSNSKTPAPSQHLYPTIAIRSDQDFWKNKILMSKPYKEIQFSAFKLFDDESLRDIFIVAAVTEKKPYPSSFGYAVSHTTLWYSNKEFDIVGDTTYIIDSQKNLIDVYDITNDRAHSLKFRESISLPNYKLGTLYAIECKSYQCDLNTAYHLEGGCRMSLNVKTKEFTQPKCYSGQSEVIPEPM